MHYRILYYFEINSVIVHGPTTVLLVERKAFTKNILDASVGCQGSQNTWLLLLEQYVNKGKHGIWACNRPPPQQASAVTENPSI